MTPDTYRISTPLARLFLALVETLHDPELLTDLQATWEVQPGISTFSLTAQRRARARLADLEPADLHRRIRAQGISTHALREMLTTFRLPLTAAAEESEEAGWSLFYEEFSEQHGFLVWSIYSPAPDWEEALEHFRQLFFPGQPDSEAFRAAVIVLPGFYRHPGAAPGQDRALETMPSGTSGFIEAASERRLVNTDMSTPPSGQGVSVPFFTRWTRLSLTPDALLRLFGGEVAVPAEVASLSDISASLQLAFNLSVDEVARLLGTTRMLALRHDPPDLDVLDRLYALGGLIDLFGKDGGQSGLTWFTQPQPVLGRRPIDLCCTRYGLARVEDVLQALQDGVFA